MHIIIVIIIIIINLVIIIIIIVINVVVVIIIILMWKYIYDLYAAKASYQSITNLESEQRLSRHD